MAEPGEDSTESPTEARRSAPRRKRVWLSLLLAFVASLILVVVGGLWVLGNLDHPWVRSKVENTLSNLVGTEVRYEGLSLSPFSGLELRGLVVATPETLRSHAPDMLRLEELRIPIELGQLLSGDLVIPAIDGGPVELTVVISDDGRNSFSELMQSEGDLRRLGLRCREASKPWKSSPCPSDPFNLDRFASPRSKSPGPGRACGRRTSSRWASSRMVSPSSGSRRARRSCDLRNGTT